MKILQVITSLQIGGAERLVTQMAIAMTEMGHTVDVCVFNGEETIFTKELHEKGIKVIGFGTSVYNPLYVLKLAKLMRNYDIVHTHNSSSAVCGHCEHDCKDRTVYDGTQHF